ncbi:expressed unknown protein [Seminavis robusta]|uniref:Uncharacterized protein n=1 Tax=Seminavis robusta TaxID=568900 RepID=A0A9N8E9H9_9STRA|nr:expressed unknown protein [Seminavis robusta]|eukprot:Sro695_g188750.1 n/a (302) ;mRNA; f:37955-38860
MKARFFVPRSLRKRLPKKKWAPVRAESEPLKDSSLPASSIKKEPSVAKKSLEVNPSATATAKEATPQKAMADEPPLTNPFNLLAASTENVELSSRLRAFSNNFGIIGALWCTLSISALSVAPIDDVYKDTERIENISPESTAVLVHRRTTKLVVPTPKPPPDGRRRKPVLVKYFGMSEHLLEDIYMASWSASFFASAIGLGLSTVVSGIVASTAPAYVKIFVRRHSDILLAIPMCQALSSGCAGIGLSVGLDEARGEPVSFIGFAGTIGGAAVVGNATFKVLKGYKAYRAAGKLSAAPKQP